MNRKELNQFIILHGTVIGYNDDKTKILFSPKNISPDSFNSLKEPVYCDYLRGNSEDHQQYKEGDSGIVFAYNLINNDSPFAFNFLFLGVLSGSKYPLPVYNQKLLESYDVQLSDYDYTFNNGVNGTKLKLNKDSSIFDGGENGGMVIVQNLIDKINRLENDINKLKQAFAMWVVVPQDGGAALKAITADWYGNQIIPITQVSDLENTKVKH